MEDPRCRECQRENHHGCTTTSTTNYPDGVVVFKCCDGYEVGRISNKKKGR